MACVPMKTDQNRFIIVCIRRIQSNDTYARHSSAYGWIGAIVSLQKTLKYTADWKYVLHVDIIPSGMIRMGV